MSHFSVLVIIPPTQHPQSAIELELEPFWELDLSHEEMRLDRRAVWQIEVPKANLAKYQKESMKGDYWRDKPQEKKKYLAMTPEAFVKEYAGYHFDKKGNAGYYHNPNAKWDWYSIGGRWSFMLKAKNGAKGWTGDASWTVEDKQPPKGYWDILAKKDIDFKAMEQDHVAIRLKRYAVEIEPVIKDETIDGTLAFFKYGLEKVGDRWETAQEYADRDKQFTTFAILYDGEWIERGKMGWWACVSNEKEKDHWEEEFKTVIDKADKNDLFAIVDCHI
jgi:hypothetical protein